MIRQSGRTGRTFSTSSIQREVIQAQGHTGSNQNCTFSRASGCAVTLAGNRRPRPGIPGGFTTTEEQGGLQIPIASEVVTAAPRALRGVRPGLPAAPAAVTKTVPLADDAQGRRGRRSKRITNPEEQGERR